MRAILKIFAVIEVLTVCGTNVAIAATPHQIPYQGRLTNALGSPVADGVYQVNFAIYNVASGGSALWSSGFQSIATANGLFSYNLGSSTTLPAGLFYDTTLYLGITIGADPEITPRTRLLSAPFGYQSERADTASDCYNADSLGGQAPSHYLDWNNLTNVPADFADGVDDNSGGDITGVTAGSGLSGGGVTGDVTIEITPDGITSAHIGPGAVGSSEIATQAVQGSNVAMGSITGAHIMDGSILDNDIANTAAIAVTKIQGTAMNLQMGQTVTGEKIFTTLSVKDSVFKADANGVRLGDNGATSSLELLRGQRTYSDPGNTFGVVIALNNEGAGRVTGVRGDAGNISSAGTGDRYGGQFLARNSSASSGNRYGVVGDAGVLSNSSGISYGLYGWARGGTETYGVYANASGNGTSYGIYALGTGPTNYSGYFAGNVVVTGTLSKGAGAFKIDHPLDPENKYLQHSFVESPDMMNVYNGNITTDANGDATIQLPDYFSALNRDFRYQLTVIGQFAQAIVSEDITGNQFSIKTNKPNVKVSWQVTGIRKDKYANEHRIEVEIDKPQKDRGRYLHYQAYGLGIDRAIESERAPQQRAQNSIAQSTVNE